MGGFRPELFRAMSMARGVFPNLFTLWCLALSAPAIITGWFIASDPTVRYFVGPQTRYLCFIPPLVVACHVLHMRAGQPKFLLVTLSTVIPAIAIIIVSYMTYAPVGHMVEQLISKDCRTYDMKYHLERANVQAQSVLMDCISRVSKETKSSEDEVRATIALQDCKEYLVPPNGTDPFAAWRHEWVFLRSLEQNEFCTGWCVRSPPLFVRQLEGGAPIDICSNVAAVVMGSAVKRSALRMVASAVMGFATFVVTVVLMQEKSVRGGAPEL